MGAFADTFKRFHKTVIRNADLALQAGVRAMATEALSRTPVDTGTLAAGWNLTTGKEATSFAPTLALLEPSANRLDGAIQMMTVLEPYYFFSNAVPYAEDVEFYGGSLQSPDPKGATTFPHKPGPNDPARPRLMLSASWPLFVPAVEAEARRLGGA